MSSQSCSLLGMEWFFEFEDVVQSFLNTCLYGSFLRPHLTMHQSEYRGATKKTNQLTHACEFPKLQYFMVLQASGLGDHVLLPL